MTIQLFDIQDKRLVPGISCHVIPELKAIMTNFPDEYLKVYWYIFCMTCPDGSNPHINAPEHEKEEIILQDIRPYTFWIEDLSIAYAIEKCRQMYETPMLRIWRGAKMMLDEMATKLGEPLIFGKEGNATDMRGIMKEIRQYTEDFLKMESMMKEEQAKVRGNVRIPHHQVPGYTEKEDNIEL